MATFFVDAGSGSDSNDGLDNIGVGLTVADWTESTLTLVETSHGYTFAAGDVINVTAGTGVTTGLYEVVSSTANNIVLKGTSTLPGVGNATDFAAGDLSNSDIVSATGPWVTIDKAMNTLGVGDKAWVRSGTSYTETATIDTGGSAGSSSVYEGYTTTLGDEGRCVIDGASTRANGINTALSVAYHVFKNIEIKGCTGNGFSVGAADFGTFKNCYCHNNGASGFVADDAWNFEGCISESNSSLGFDADNNSLLVGCYSHSNSGKGIEIAWGCVLNCVIHNNAGTGIDLRAVTNKNTAGVVGNCTLADSDGASGNGIDISSASTSAWTVFNTIIDDQVTGLRSGQDIGERSLSFNNLLFSNSTADYANATTHTGEVTSDPLFTDGGNDDYTLGSSSPAKAAGVDAGEIINAVSYIDIGAHQRQEPAGGGGGMRLVNGGLVG